MIAHLATIALAVVGLVLSAGLVQSQLDVFGGGLAGGWLCSAVDAGAGCDAVSAHPSSWLLGYPVPVWGLMYFFAVLGVATAAALLRGVDRKAFTAFGVLLVGAGLLVDARLAWLMATEVGALCVDCVATYVTNVALFAAFLVLDRRTRSVPLRWTRLFPSWRALRSGRDELRFASLFKIGGSAAWITLALTAFVQALAPFQQVADEGSARVQEMLVRLMQDEPDVDMARFDERPSLGSPDALVHVAVVADFQCVFCRSIARALADLLDEWPEDLRVSFVNSPVSSTCNPAIELDVHPDACWLARLATCAREQDAFERLHDWLFLRLPFPRVDREHVTAHLDTLGLDTERLLSCADAERSARSVSADIALCAELGLTSTPSIVVNGFVTKGTLPPFALRELLELMLARVQQLRDADDALAPASDGADGNGAPAASPDPADAR